MNREDNYSSKKNNLLRANNSYTAEHTIDTKKWFNLNRININNLVFSTKRLTRDIYLNAINNSDQIIESDIENYINMDTDLLRLYMAISIANLCDDAIANGVSVMDAEDLKRECLIELSQLKQVESMTELSINMAIKYNSLYISQLNNQYSYCVSQAIEYIKQHRLAPCTPKLVSEYIDVNSSYLSRKFHEETGVTLTDFIKKEKMNLAAELINRKLYSLHEISSLLGYENYSYFSRVYKEYFGASPTQYLKE